MQKEVSVDDNEFDYNGYNEEDADENLEDNQDEELEEQEESEQEQEDQLTFEQEILRQNLNRRLDQIDLKVNKKPLPILNSQEKEIMRMAKSDKTLKPKAYKTEIKRGKKVGQFWLKAIQTIAPAIPFILLGVMILFVALAFAAAIDSIFSSIFGGGGSTGGSCLNSQFWAFGKDIYAVRLVYEDQTEAGKFVLNDYASVVYDSIGSLKNGEDYTLNINLSLPEDLTADYNDETADEKIKTLMSKLTEIAYVYDNPDYASNGVDLATLTLTQKAEGVKYFGLDSELVSKFKDEIVSNFLLFKFNEDGSVLSYTSLDPENPADKATVEANIKTALETYFANLSTVRSEKYFVKDCVLSDDEMLKDVEQKNYVTMMYLPKKNLTFTDFKIYTYGADPSQLSMELNGKTYTNYEEWPIDDDKTMYTYSLDDTTATAVTGYDPESAVTSATALYKLVGTPNADNYATENDGIFTYKDFGMVIKFSSSQPFSFIDEVTLK